MVSTKRFHNINVTNRNRNLDSSSSSSGRVGLLEEHVNKIGGDILVSAFVKVEPPISPKGKEKIM